MKMPKGSLCELIGSKFGFEVNSDDFYTVFAHTLSYITRGIDYSEYQKRLKPFCREEEFSAKDFRLHLHRTEYLSLGVRLFVLRFGKARGINQDAAKQFAAEYAVPNCDARRIYRFWKEQRRFRTRIRTEAKSYDVGTHLNLALTRHALHQVMKPVNKYIKSHTYKKLRFICKSQNLDLADMHAELAIKAVSAFYKMMPCRMEALHVVNYLKRSVHNGGINIIDANTSQKSGRLVNNKGRDGEFVAPTLVVVSENQMRAGAEGEQISYEELVGHDPIEQVVVEHSISKIVATVKPGCKKHKFLTILMGVDDAQFTDWLRRNRYCTSRETNSDYQSRECPTKFNILLGRFLRVRAEQVNKFLGTLRTCLEPDTLADAA